jgi:hypothetical protein
VFAWRSRRGRGVDGYGAGVDDYFVGFGNGVRGGEEGEGVDFVGCELGGLV